MKSIRSWTTGVGMTLLVAMVGCDGAPAETEELWVGVIDPSEEGGEALDDEVMVGDSPAESTGEAAEWSTKETQPASGEEPVETPAQEEEVVDQEPVTEPDSTPVSEEKAEETGNDIAIESESDHGVDEESEKAEDTGQEANVEDAAVPTSGYVLFSVDMGCSQMASGEPVFVLGMDKWNEEWSIAVELEETEIPGHYSGVWEGEAGEYSFLLSYGGYEHEEWSPWFGVESLEGQACVGDAYDNRAVVVELGLATNLSLTHGYCNGCPGSCSGLCGGQSDDGGCFCDSLCEEYGDCCADYGQVCAVVSCDGHCGGKPEQANCYCDSLCSSYNDCCDDYSSVCGE